MDVQSKDHEYTGRHRLPLQNQPGKNTIVVFFLIAAQKICILFQYHFFLSIENRPYVINFKSFKEEKT